MSPSAAASAAANSLEAISRIPKKAVDDGKTDRMNRMV
jgi:hypothetical protein